MERNVANPGSDAAIALGCVCPVLDNGHGNERLGRERGFVINLDCPLHGMRGDKSGQCTGDDVAPAGVLAVKS